MVAKFDSRRPPPVAVQLGGGPAMPSKTAPPFVDDVVDEARDAVSAVVSGTDHFLVAWREFALRKDILNTATGFMIGGALTSLIHSLVNDVLTPLIMVAWQSRDALDGAFLVLRFGHSNATRYVTPEAAHADGAITLNYGHFASTTLDFTIHSLFIFVLFRLVRRLQRTADGAAEELTQRL